MVRFTNLLNSCLIISLFIISNVGLNAQVTIEGPAIVNYGDTYQVDIPEYYPDFDVNGLKVVFDITDMGASPQEVSAQINTVARCINMHAHSGLSIDKMEINVVFHSYGTYTILNDEAHIKKYGVRNPHLDLFKQLNHLGVKLYVCGQSLSARNVKRDELYPEVKIALSAMTVLTDLQMKGFALIKF